MISIKETVEKRIKLWLKEIKKQKIEDSFQAGHKDILDFLSKKKLTHNYLISISMTLDSILRLINDKEVKKPILERCK